MSALRQISKNGHSLVLTLPKPFLTELGLTYGSVVILELIENTIVISKAVSARTDPIATTRFSPKAHVP